MQFGSQNIGFQNSKVNHVNLRGYSNVPKDY